MSIPLFRWSRLPSTYRVRWGGAPAPLLSSGVSRMGGQHQISDPHGAHRRVCVYPHPPSRSFSHCSRSDLRNTMDTVEVSWLVRSHTTLKHITPSLNTIEQFFGPISVHGHNSKTWVCRKEEKKKKKLAAASSTLQDPWMPTAESDLVTQLSLSENKGGMSSTVPGVTFHLIDLLLLNWMSACKTSSKPAICSPA